MRILALALLLLFATGCSGATTARTTARATGVLGARVQHCVAGELLPLGSVRKSFAGLATRGAVAYARPAGAVRARFGPKNVNDYPTVFAVLGAVVHRDCTPAWYRVELPLKPNGATGFVRASALRLAAVDVRIVVDVSARRLTLFRNGKPELTATVAVGAPSTPTPTRETTTTASAR